jgi:hypothetical protein
MALALAISLTIISLLLVTTVLWRLLAIPATLLLLLVAASLSSLCGTKIKAKEIVSILKHSFYNVSSTTVTYGRPHMDDLDLRKASMMEKVSKCVMSRPDLSVSS